MSDYGIFGVDAERKEHPAIKSGKKELGDTSSPINAYKVDGQRLYKGPGTAGMDTTPRKRSGTAGGTSRPVTGFRVRKRTLKG